MVILKRKNLKQNILEIESSENDNSDKEYLINDKYGTNLKTDNPEQEPSEKDKSEKDTSETGQFWKGRI